MGFWAAAGSAFAGGVGSAAGSSAGAALLGRDSPERSRRDMRIGYDVAFNYGYKRTDQYDWRQAQKRGLTPQEFYGSAAAAGASAGESSAAVLGNKGHQRDLATQEAAAQGIQADLDRQAMLKKTEMDNTTAKEIAELQAGTSVKTTEMQNETQKLIEKNKLSLATDIYKNVTLKESAARLKIMDAELDTALNNAVTSAPKWQKLMKLMTMAPANILATMFAAEAGDITDEKTLRNMSPAKKKALVSAILASESHLRKEYEGMGSILDEIFSVVKSDIDEQKKKDLERQALEDLEKKKHWNAEVLGSSSKNRHGQRGNPFARAW